MTYLDTHVVVWLYFGLAEKISTNALAAIEAGDLLVSPMVILELGYLHETGRIKTPAEKIRSDLEHQFGLTVCTLPFLQVVTEALNEKWTRDPFDRLIVAQARGADAKLISKDRLIQRHYRKTIW